MSHHNHVAATFISEPLVARVQEAAQELGYRFSPYLLENDFLSALGMFPPDVVVMGLDYDSSRPLMLQRSLWQARDPAVVVYLAEHPEVSAVVAARNMGAIFVLGSHIRIEELKKALTEACVLCAARSQWVREIRDAQQRISQLSKRQFQLMQHTLTGHTNQAIGLELNLSVKTVEKHRVMIRHRTATSSLIELERLNCVANRPITAAYGLNAQEMLSFREPPAANRSAANTQTTDSGRKSALNAGFPAWLAFEAAKDARPSG